MTITVHGGHNQIVRGACGYLDETAQDRAIKDAVIKRFEKQGIICYDTTDDVGKTQSMNLANIVANCNKHNAVLNLSIHLNAGGGNGVECWIYPGSVTASIYAQEICKRMVEYVGFNYRGVKSSKNLYVLRKTKAPTVLVECGFVDSKLDYQLFNVNTIAEAIVDAVLDVAGINRKSNVTTETPKAEPVLSSKTESVVNYEMTVRTLKNGSSGADVKALQILLVGNGFSVGYAGCDGKFGGGTKSAVTAYQKHTGLSADGIVGKNTWNKLING